MSVVEQVLDDRNGIVAGRRRIARAVGRGRCRRASCARISSATVVGRHHGDLGAEPGKQAQDVALDAVVDGDDVRCDGSSCRPKPCVPGPGRLAPDRSSGRQVTSLRQVEPDQARARPRPRRFRSSRSKRAVGGMRDDARWACPCRGSARSARRVSMPAKRDDAAALQPGVEAAAAAR